MGYVAPTWQNGGPPALNAKNMQDISDNLAYISNHMVNDKLLDNWYFANPVDQMKGYVVPPGIEYKDTSSGTTVGVTAAYYPVLQFIDQNAIINIAGTNYFVRPGGYVRGYTGTGYTIDRWRIDDSGGAGSLRINSDKTITISNGAAQEPIWFTQLLENVIPGTRTASSLVTGITGSANMYSGASTGMELLLGLNVMQSSEENNIGMRIVVYPNSSVTLKAVGLEPGSQQTLCHKEYGEWVLNEIPKFGDQLAECQRYYYKPYHVLLWRTPGTNSLTVDANFKVDMRTIPTVTYANPLTVLVPGKTATGHISISNLVVNVGGVGNCDLTSVDPSDAEVLQIKGGQIAFSADL